ncbi:MAG TPA: YbhB/YbcL family Raf kinase inhibitor-like protein [Terriglobales bacterium]|nr:YbhB/YbcL family Raf kinase inhibitor-like protein [Terriglobales bacterium]
MLRLTSLLLLAAFQFAAQKGATMPFSLQSSAFKEGADIPRQYTCEGADVSPALAWSEPPSKTQTFALIADDPDAPVGTWVHWVAWNIPATARQLPENVSKTAELAGGGHQGTNDFRKTGYGGPCPPPGKAHRYFFKLYALDAKLELKPGATKKDLEQAMKGHILAETQLMGKYQRGR